MALGTSGQSLDHLCCRPRLRNRTGPERLHRAGGISSAQDWALSAPQSFSVLRDDIDEASACQSWQAEYTVGPSEAHN
jgi:hypothetical protein